LLLLDEPLGSLDEERKVEVLPYLVRLRDEAGIPIVYVSHDASEMGDLRRRAWCLSTAASPPSAGPKCCRRRFSTA